MVIAFFPQSHIGQIDVNTNYPPQSFTTSGGGELTIDDEDSLIGEVTPVRENVDYLSIIISPNRGHVDFEAVI